MTTKQQELHPSVVKFLSTAPKQMLINGKFVSSKSGKTFDTVNPATGETIVKVYEADKEDIDLAVKAARAAFEGPWKKVSPYQRQQLLLKVADLIEKNAEEFAQLETLDNGKPINESKHVDVPVTVEHFRYYAGWATKIHGETLPVSCGNYLTYTLREPVGVVGQIIPWNFPLLMAAWKIAAALACGNCVVLKPAEQTPLTALRLGEILMEAGFPAGVVNICPGFGPTAGAALSSHSDVDKVAFTGEYTTGREIIKASAGNLKRVSLELGGKSPNIVFMDGDIEGALKGCMGSVFFNQGQVCCAGTRLFVESKIYDDFVNKLSDKVKKIKLGPGLSPDTQMGPLVSEDQLKRVTGYLDIGKKEGAKALCGGDRAKDGDLQKGYFVQPTVFADVNNKMRIAQEEIFGPVVSAIPFKDVNDAVFQGNETTYGLAAGVWTNNLKKAHSVARALKAGTVWVNCYNVFDPCTPFGGYKQSGYGREGGIHALELYTQVKSVFVNLD
ncbi:MAG: betaine-aldehyde dehydrogenase [Candidatus Melainabacteria bacterium RIFCSPLOWO2_02_FULL_35_15]|nr:MAG: betaine-aldehyde dehydrogenase [Candidatus Melainabacteria bacterium RIFCSPLOWO2_12_FULL_35_11]OGI13118.1 MAG: betaine-aldehyde dehydrogenase [Candidatus Melainabacteria bacterium RIFCSPLOWO2_02_FULL_35_15]